MDKSGYKRKGSYKANIVRGILAVILLIPVLWLIITIINNFFNNT